MERLGAFQKSNLKVYHGDKIKSLVLVGLSYKVVILTQVCWNEVVQTLTRLPSTKFFEHTVIELGAWTKLCKNKHHFLDISARMPLVFSVGGPRRSSVIAILSPAVGFTDPGRRQVYDPERIVPTHLLWPFYPFTFRRPLDDTFVSGCTSTVHCLSTQTRILAFTSRWGDATQVLAGERVLFPIFYHRSISVLYSQILSIKSGPAKFSHHWPKVLEWYQRITI